STDRRRSARDPPLHAFEMAEGCEDGRLRRTTAESSSGRPGPRDRAVANARAEIRGAQRGARPLKKSHPVLERSKAEIFAFIDHLVVEHDGLHVAPLCRRYHVTRAGYYAWRHRDESAHTLQDRRLSAEIHRLFALHHERYGSPRLHHELVTSDGA